MASVSQNKGGRSAAGGQSAGGTLRRGKSTRKADPILGAVDRPDTLAEQAYTNIRSALMNGLLAPGERVSVRRIAETFGISLTPAREALAHLAAERALKVDPRRTFSVPVLNRATYRELLSIRLLLEGYAAEAATPRLSASDLDELAEINKRFSESIDRGHVKESLELNRRFHFSIYRAASMSELFGLIEGLWLRVGPTFNLFYPEYQSGRGGLHNHLAALDALRAGDATRAKAAIEQDLSQGAKFILQLLDD